MTSLEYILKETGIKQSEIADALGIKQQNISMWVKGNKPIPEKYLPKLSEMTHVDKELIELDPLSELNMAKIDMELLISKGASEDEILLAESRINECDALMLVRLYIEKNMGRYIENFDIDPREHYKVMFNNANRIKRLVGLLGKVSAQTSDAIIQAYEMLKDEISNDMERERSQRKRRR